MSDILYCGIYGMVSFVDPRMSRGDPRTRIGRHYDWIIRLRVAAPWLRHWSSTIGYWEPILIPHFDVSFDKELYEILDNAVPFTIADDTEDSDVGFAITRRTKNWGHDEDWLNLCMCYLAYIGVHKLRPQIWTWTSQFSHHYLSRPRITRLFHILRNFFLPCQQAFSLVSGYSTLSLCCVNTTFSEKTTYSMMIRSVDKHSK